MTSIAAASVVENAQERLAAARVALQAVLTNHDLQLDDLRFESDGALVIAGEAASLAAKKRILRLAAAASGADGLVDRVHVRPALAMGDGEIRARLVEIFAHDPRFKDLALREDRNPSPLAEDYVSVAGDAADAAGVIALEVRDGVVVLDGRVPSLVRKRLAGVIAWRLAGVRDVVNGLAVEPPETDSPDELEEAVRAALDGHPLLDDAQVKVGVRADVVRLTGLVHSEAARQAAEDEAWRVLGVDEVVNEIQVRA